MHHEPRSRWHEKAIYVLVLLACAAGFAALGVALSAKDESGDVKRKVARAGPPCVDANGKKAGVVPSRGCAAVFRLLVEKCVRDPGFCRRSERQAVRQAQERSVERAIGPHAQLNTQAQLRGGGDSKGKSNPKSPRPPSPRPPGDGGGGGGKPTNPGQPEQPSSPATPDQPPAEEPPTEPPANPTNDVPQALEDAVCTVASPLGPVVIICPGGN